MEPNKSIHEIYTRFIAFVSEVVSLGKKITNKKMVGKILRSIPTTCEPKVMIIEEAKYLKTLNFDEFIGTLIAHEGKIKELEVKDSEVKQKSLALKSVNNYEDKNRYNDQEDDDDDIAMIAKRFTKFLRMKTYGNQRNFRRERGVKGESNNRDHNLL